MAINEEIIQSSMIKFKYMPSAELESIIRERDLDAWSKEAFVAAERVLELRQQAKVSSVVISLHEKRLLVLMSQGVRDLKIADMLRVSSADLHRSQDHLRKKFGAKDNTELIQLARQAGHLPFAALWTQEPPATEQPKMQVRICVECGTHNLKNAWYCRSCGKTLSVDTISDLDITAIDPKL